jgi:hypothetical protein
MAWKFGLQLDQTTPAGSPSRLQLLARLTAMTAMIVLFWSSAETWWTNSYLPGPGATHPCEFARLAAGAIEIRTVGPSPRLVPLAQSK